MQIQKGTTLYFVDKSSGAMFTQSIMLGDLNSLCDIYDIYTTEEEAKAASEKRKIIRQITHVLGKLTPDNLEKCHSYLLKRYAKS